MSQKIYYLAGMSHNKRELPLNCIVEMQNPVLHTHPKGVFVLDKSSINNNQLNVKTMSQFFNILTKKEIIINETTGEQKTLWFTAGSLKVTDKGRSYLTLFQSPDVDYFVFPKRTEEELPTVQLEDSTDETYDATQ